jgi:hypothetical protein
MNGRTVLILLSVAMLVVPTSAAAAVEGEPKLDASLADNRVTPGESTTLGVTITNTAELESLGSADDEQRVTTAKGITAELQADDAPIEVKTGTVSLGSLPDGGLATSQFDITVDDDATAGTYEVVVDLEYRYVEEIIRSGEDGFIDYDTRTEDIRLDIVVEEGPTFEIVSSSTDTPIGGSGTVDISVQNTGGETASDASFSLQSENSELTFGGSSTVKSHAGDWATGDVRSFSFTASVGSDVQRRPLSLVGTISYESDDTDADGNALTERDTLSIGVVPAAEQSISLAQTDATLRVGEEGRLSGQVVNDGPREIENAVLVLQPVGSSIDSPETEFAVGDLNAGASAGFQYEVEVSSEARDGPRQFTYRLEYDDTNGDSRQSDALYARHAVAEKRQVFDVEAETVASAGSSTIMEITVTNNNEQELSDVTAKLFADSPIAVDDDEAFAATIPAGESRTLKFTITVAGGATPKVYPVSMDFQYDEPDGDTKLSDTYQVPVEVTEQQGGGLLSTVPFGMGGVGIGALVLGIGGVAFAIRGRRT